MNRFCLLATTILTVGSGGCGDDQDTVVNVDTAPDTEVSTEAEREAPDTLVGDWTGLFIVWSPDDDESLPRSFSRTSGGVLIETEIAYELRVTESEASLVRVTTESETRGGETVTRVEPISWSGPWVETAPAVYTVDLVTNEVDMDCTRTDNDLTCDNVGTSPRFQRLILRR